MRIKKFHGRNMRDSLEQMRRDLGEEAIILSSREIHEPGSLPVTEVVAGIEPEELELHRQHRRVPVEIAYAAGTPRTSAHRSVQKDADVAPIAPSAPLGARHGTSTPQTESILSELRSLKEQLATKQTLSPNAAIFCPPSYAKAQRTLEDAGFSAHFSQSTLQALYDSSADSTVEGLSAALRSHLLSCIKTAQPIRPAESTKVVLVCGAPGSGKSSIVSKLAATFALTMNASSMILQPSNSQQNQPLGLATISMKSYSSADDLVGAMQATDDQDFVFIELQCDRANADTLAHIKQFRALCNAESTLLTVSANSSDVTTQDWLNIAQNLDQSSVVFTQLDCNKLKGSTLEMLEQADVPVSFVSDGRSIPQSIKAATPERILESVLTRTP